jgi:rhodanese-related sulfurtransferase
MRLGIGETLLPLGALRSRLHELPQDKGKEVILYCKISLRGYEAATILEGAGFTNVKVMEGGVMAWPYPREK